VYTIINAKAWDGVVFVIQKTISSMPSSITAVVKRDHDPNWTIKFTVDILKYHPESISVIENDEDHAGTIPLIL
jgi:hypothetical protein